MGCYKEIEIYIFIKNKIIIIIQTASRKSCLKAQAVMHSTV